MLFKAKYLIKYTVHLITAFLIGKQRLFEIYCTKGCDQLLCHMLLDIVLFLSPGTIAQPLVYCLEERPHYIYSQLLECVRQTVDHHGYIIRLL